jgi:hypothetical protein
MWINTLQEQATQAAEVSFNTNSWVSTVTNQLLSLFEGGYDSLYIRNRVDHLLREYAVTNRFASNMWWDQLRALTSLKEKFAFTIGHDYAKNSGTRTLDVQLLDETYIKNAVNYVQEHLFAKLDISESFILRHAALNNFETKYTPQEGQKIVGVWQQLLKIAEDNDATIVAGAMHFQQESDVQKMFKIRESVQMLTKAWIPVDKGILDSIDGLSEKIEPLLKLDKSYKHMTQMHSMLNTLGQNVKHSMISPNQKTKLLAVVADLGKKPSDFIIPLDSRRTVQEYLGELMNQTNRATLDEVLKKNVLTRKEFEQWFLSYFAFYNVEESRQQLQDAKSLAFGHRAPRYEQDVTFWRWSAKQRILEVAERMKWGNFLGEPAPGGQLLPNVQHSADFQLVNNYFNSFRSLFAADPVQDWQSFKAMRKIVSALVRIRAPLLSRDQRLVEVMRKKFKIYSDKEFIAYRDCTDSADVIASVIILQGNAAQDMYYEDSHKNISPETFGQKIAKNVSRAHHGYQAVKKRLASPLKKLFGLAENVARGVGAAVGYTVAATTNVVAWSYVDRVTKEKRTRGFSFGWYNRWLEKKYARWKLPLYITLPITRLVEEGAKLGNRASIVAMEWWGKLRKMGIEELRKETGDQTVNHLSHGLLKVLNACWMFVSKSVAAWGQALSDALETKQQRRVLAAFYEAAAMDKDIAGIMQWADLANMLNTKDYGPYLFDEDGRGMVATTEEKYPDTAAWEKALTKYTFEQMYDDTFDQRRAHNEMLEDKYNALNNKLDDMMPSDAWYDEISAQLQEVNLIRDTRSKKAPHMDSLQNFFAEVAAWRQNFTWFQTEVQAIHDRLKTEMDVWDALISDPATWFKKQILDKTTQIDDANREIGEIDLKLWNTVKKNDKSTTDLKAEKTTVEWEINANKLELVNLEDQCDISESQIGGYEYEIKSIKEELVEAKKLQIKMISREPSIASSQLEINDVQKDIDKLNDELDTINQLPAVIKRYRTQISRAKPLEGQIVTLEDTILNAPALKAALIIQLAEKQKFPKKNKIEIDNIQAQIKTIDNAPATLAILQKQLEDIIKPDTDLAIVEKKLEDAELLQINAAKERNRISSQLRSKNDKKDSLERTLAWDKRETFFGKDPKDAIADHKDVVDKLEQNLRDKIVDLEKEKKNRAKLKQDAEMKKQEIEAKKNQLSSIIEKIALKDDADLSRAEYETRKSTLKSDIVAFEQQKKDLEKKMKKQEQENRVHRQAWKWSKTLLSHAERITTVDALLNANERRRELMKYLKTIKLEFYKKPSQAVVATLPAAPAVAA